MKFFKVLALLGFLGLVTMGVTFLGYLRVQRQSAESSRPKERWIIQKAVESEVPGQSETSLHLLEEQERESSSGTRGSAGLPEWFQAGWQRTQNSQLLGVSVEGQISLAAAEEELLSLLREEILLKLGCVNVTDPNVLPELSPEFIRSQLVPAGRLEVQPYEDELTREAAVLQGRTTLPYYRGFVQARLSPEFFDLANRWKRYPERRESLKWVGLGAVGVLALLSLMFSFLKVDHLTQSHYSRRLQTLTATVLLAVLAIIYWLS